MVAYSLYEHRIEVVESELFVNTDADGKQTLSYNIDSGSDATLFNINTTNGSLYLNEKNLSTIFISATDGYTSETL